MPIGQIGAFLLVLLVVFTVGNIWYHLVEAILGRIRSLFTRHREPPAWHPLPPEKEDAPDGRP